MQIATFTDGGFVIHKIKHPGGRKMSAWYDKAGALLDMEAFNGIGHNTAVYPADREFCAHIGRIHNPNNIK